MNLDTDSSAPEPTAVEATAPATPATPAAEAAPAKSMDDTIRDTLRDLTAAPTSRERGPDGRFLRNEDSTEAPGDTGAGATAPETSAPASPPEPKPWDAAPNAWKKDVATAYAALPEPVRQEIHRREEDFHRGIAQYKDAAAFGHSMFEDISPHFETMRQMGAAPREVVREVMGAWRELATGTPDQKRATLLRLADAYGISRAEFDGARDRDFPANPELAPVLQRLAQLEGTITESQRAREAAEQAERVAQATKFLNDPAHEHIDTVLDDVLILVRAGKSPADAYQQAIWAHPETRAKLIAKQEDERKQREAAEAAAARKAATVNVQRRGTPPVATKPGTIEDTIRQTYRQLNQG